jgi:hypothetical protein
MQAMMTPSPQTFTNYYYDTWKVWIENEALGIFLFHQLGWFASDSSYRPLAISLLIVAPIFCLVCFHLSLPSKQEERYMPAAEDSAGEQQAANTTKMLVNLTTALREDDAQKLTIAVQPRRSSLVPTSVSSPSASSPQNQLSSPSNQSDLVSSSSRRGSLEAGPSPKPSPLEACVVESSSSSSAARNAPKMNNFLTSSSATATSPTHRNSLAPPTV